MTTATARLDILTFFSTNFAAIAVNTSLGLDELPTVIYDNLSKPPQDTSLSWVRVSIRHNVGGQETLGISSNRKFLRRGDVFIQIFTPLDEGMQLADYLSDQILAFLEGGATSTEKIAFHSVTPPNDLGNEGSWNQVNINASFFYEVIN